MSIQMLKRQRGVALLTVLLVVAIVTVLSAALIARQQLVIRSTTNQQLARQAWHYALGGEALAQVVLEQDFKAAGANPGEQVDHLEEAWARSLPVFDIQQGEISVRIEDPLARFNLNSLWYNNKLNQAALDQFRRLLQRLELNPAYAERLLDWLDADQQVRGELGAEDNAYLGLQPDYRAGNQGMRDVTELRLLLGMSEADYRTLLPYVSVVMVPARLNVNTASPLLISTLADGLDEQAVLTLLEGRGPSGYRQLADFLGKSALAGMAVQRDGLVLGSSFFIVRTEVRVAERQQVVLSTLQRDANGKVLVLSRNLGQASQRLARPKQIYMED